MAKPKSIRNRWKGRERKVAKLLGGNAHRNPLSGGSNVNDQGHKRVGDIVGVEDWLVEVKDTSSKDAMYTFYKKVKSAGPNPVPMIQCFHDIKIPENAMVESKLPCVLHERMVIMNMTDFLFMMKEGADPTSPWLWCHSITHAYYTKRFPFGAWWDKLEVDWTSGRRSGAVKETQLPLLIVHPKGKREQLAIIKLNDLIKKLDLIEKLGGNL